MTGLNRLVGAMRGFVAVPPWGRMARRTPARLRNLYLNRWEHWSGRTVLRSSPIKLIVEPTNVCNLHCPCCFTGDGQVGRERSAMSLDLYRSLLAELGDHLFEVEAFNWGEPLLSRHIYTMVEEASARGIATTVNTNFSLPFDAGKAERLVRTGLSALRVSIDGARQETYQQYRVGGRLETVLANARLVLDARRRLRSATPQVIWEYHVFPHNVDEVAPARALAERLGMVFLPFKGQLPGQEWGIGSEWQFCHEPQIMPCASLWAIAVVHNDGGVAPCNGTFYREDDLGRVALGPGELGTASFREVWNGPRYQAARRFFAARAGSAEEQGIVCFNCPNTLTHEAWLKHRIEGGTRDSFRIGYGTNDVWNYFWNRRPPGERTTRRAGAGRA
jgi:pyruvate-formate lyase-activating enzyme